MALVTITGNTIRDAGTRKDNRAWKFRSVGYQYGGGTGGVVTTGADWQELQPVAGVLTFTAEAGIAAFIRTPDSHEYLVRIPEANAGLWDVIEAGIAFPPNTAQDRLNAAVAQYVETNRSDFRTRAVLITSGPDAGKAQWVDESDVPTGDPVEWSQVVSEAIAAIAAAAAAPDAVATDLAARNLTWEDAGGGEWQLAAGGDPIGDATTAPAATWSGVAGKPMLNAPVSNGTDDTSAIQDVLDDEPSQLVFRRGGTWIVDGTVGLSPLSNTRIVIEEGAVVTVKANAATTYRLFNIGRDGAVENVTVEGAGILRGDLDDHTGSTGEWGHIVNITNESSNIQVLGVTIEKAWGDGIYVGGGSGACTDVLIDGVTVQDCRREGIAPFWVDGCTIRNSRIRNIGLTDATSPGSGIDCEPNEGEHVSYLTIENNLVDSTVGTGIYVSTNPGEISHLVIRDNEVINCGYTEESLTSYQSQGIHVQGVEGVVLIDNVVKECGTDGTDPNPNSSGQIALRSTTRAYLKGGYIYGGRGRGIFVWGADGTEISGVTLEASVRDGIYVYQSDGVVIRNNLLIGNVTGEGASDDHIQINTSDNCLVEGNTFKGDLGRSWIRTHSASDDTLVARNTGLGAAPAALLSDTGTATAKVWNVHKPATGTFVGWTEYDLDATVVNGTAKAAADLIGWTYDPATILSGTIIPAAATIYLCRIPIPAGATTISNISVSLSTLGDTLSNAYVGLYKSDGTVLGQPADQSTAWGAAGSQGLKTIALTSPVAVTPTTTNGFVWAAIYVGAASVLPTFSRGVTSQSAILNFGPSSSRKRFASSALSNTATLTSVTPASLSSASISYWMALT